jgi:hypothetical protein
MMNRKTGYKVAMFAEPKGTFSDDKRKKLDISFWDEIDNKTESLELEISNEVMGVLRELVNDRTQVKPNIHFFNQEEIKRSSDYTSSKNNRHAIPIPQPRHLDEDIRPMVDYGNVQVEDIEHEELELEQEGIADMEDEIESTTLKRMYSTEQQNPFSVDQNEPGDELRELR